MEFFAVTLGTVQQLHWMILRAQRRTGSGELQTLVIPHVNRRTTIFLFGSQLACYFAFSHQHETACVRGARTSAGSQAQKLPRVFHIGSESMRVTTEVLLNHPTVMDISIETGTRKVYVTWDRWGVLCSAAWKELWLGRKVLSCGIARSVRTAKSLLPVMAGNTE